MPRTIATNTRADRAGLLEFLRPRHHAILMTTRKDGRRSAEAATADQRLAATAGQPLAATAAGSASSR